LILVRGQGKRGLLLFAARALSAVSVATRWLARGGRGPRTIDELLQDAAENGTHSILDIDHTADIPAFGCATPLSKQRLLKCFGTTTPTAQQVAEARSLLDEVTSDMRRWEAVYLTVHDESGEPLEYMLKGLATHSRSGKTGNLTHVQSYWQSHQESKLADQAPYLSQSKVGGQRLNLLLTLCRRNPDAAAPSDNGHSGRVGFQSRQPGPGCGITGLSKLSRPGRL